MLQLFCLYVAKVDLNVVYTYLLQAVAEPPKLYGPLVLIIVLKTSDNYTGVPWNLRRLSGVLGKPKSSTIFRAGSHFRSITILQQFI
jgi:hypothetical protein